MKKTTGEQVDVQVEPKFKTQELTSLIGKIKEARLPRRAAFIVLFGALLFISSVQAQHMKASDLILKDTRFRIVGTGTAMDEKSRMVPTISLKNVSGQTFTNVLVLAAGLETDSSLQLIIFKGRGNNPVISMPNRIVRVHGLPMSSLTTVIQVLGVVTDVENSVGALNSPWQKS